MATVKLNVENGIAILSIDRPEALNALSREIVDEIDEVIEGIKANDEIRCLILHSQKNFAAGADIKGMIDCDEESARDFAFSSTFNKIDTLKFPVIAAIEGYALGGGMELALTADIRIAGKGAKMGFPEVTLGVFPGAGGTIRAPRLIGPALAKELIFTGDAVSAERAEAMGLVNRVVEDDAVLDEALKMAARIAKRGPVAIAMAKDVINRGLDEPERLKAVDIETQQWPKLFNTKDQKEGMTAFIEKRKPVFKNE